MKKCNWGWGEAQRLRRGPDAEQRPRSWREAQRLRRGPEVEERPRGWGEAQRLGRGLEVTPTQLVDVGGFAAVASSGAAGACSPCRLGVKLLNCSQCAAFLTTSVKGYHTWKWPWSSKGESAWFTQSFVQAYISSIIDVHVIWFTQSFVQAYNHISSLSLYIYVTWFMQSFVQA